MQWKVPQENTAYEYRWRVSKAHSSLPEPDVRGLKSLLSISVSDSILKSLNNQQVLMASYFLSFYDMLCFSHFSQHFLAKSYFINIYIVRLTSIFQMEFKAYFFMRMWAQLDACIAQQRRMLTVGTFRYVWVPWAINERVVSTGSSKIMVKGM